MKRNAAVGLFTKPSNDKREKVSGVIVHVEKTGRRALSIQLLYLGMRQDQGGGGH